MSSATEASSDFHNEWTADAIIVLTCITLSLYNCIELLLTILTTFREWHSLYFISLIVASIGIFPYCLGFLLEYFGLLVFWASILFSTIGWVMLITGQSVVLYSRLGLIVQNDRILKGVKWMIIIDAIIFHTLTTVFQYCQAYGGDQAQFDHALFYMEKIQMTVFCVQEFIISGIYLWKTVDLLKLVSRKGTRKVMWELFTINAIIILMDIALLALEYKGLRSLERAFKSVIYSVKLKMEFAVLGKLVNLVQSSTRTLSATLGDVDSFRTPSTAVDSTRDDRMPDWLVKVEAHPVHVEHARQRTLDDDLLE